MSTLLDFRRSDDRPKNPVERESDDRPNLAVMTTPTSSLRTVVMMAAAVSSAFAWMPTTRLHLPARAPACSRAVPFVMSADGDDFSAEFQVRDAEGWPKPNSATCAGTDR